MRPATSSLGRESSTQTVRPSSAMPSLAVRKVDSVSQVRGDGATMRRRDCEVEQRSAELDEIREKRRKKREPKAFKWNWSLGREGRKALATACACRQNVLALVLLPRLRARASIRDGRMDGAVGGRPGKNHCCLLACLSVNAARADTIQMQGSGVAELGISGFPGPWIHAVSCLCFSDRTYNGRDSNNTSPRPWPLPRTSSMIRDSQEASSLKNV